MPEAVQGLRTMGVRGWNITMPGKNIMCKLADKVSPASEISGACNTIVNDNGVLTAYTTDGVGFMRAVAENGVYIIGKKMTLLGAGGAATAIQVQAALDGAAKISIFNPKDEFYSNAERTIEKIKNMLPQCNVNIYPIEDTEKLYAEIADSDILVNATKVGMKPLEDQSLVEDPSAFRPDLVVADVVYNPRETKLLRTAREAGCKVTVGGIGMLLWQGAEAFHLFTGKEMPADEVYELFFKE